MGMTFSFGKSQPKKAPSNNVFQITLVVRHQNDRTVIDHAFAMHNAQSEKDPAHQLDHVVAEPVIRIQNQLVTWRFNELAKDDR